MGDLRKPLVLVNGKIQRLQPGDFLKEVDSVVLQNDEAGSLIFGNVCYLSGDGQVMKAIADAAGAAKTIGLVLNSTVISAANADIITNGVMAGTDTQWDAVFGTTGGLSAGTTYYLSDTVAGKGTDTSPELTGNYSVELGIALSITTFLVSIKQPILL